MYISELMTMGQVIFNNIPVFIVMGLMIYWLNGKIESHIKETRDLWISTNQRLDQTNHRLDQLYLELINIKRGG